MRLFLREHIPLMVFTLLQILIVVLVFWLDGYNRLLTAFYAVFLGLFIFMIYLFYRYLSHSSLYRKLSTPPKSLKESIGKIGGTPLTGSFQNYSESLFLLYQHHIEILEDKQKEHTTFMNQWVHQMKTPLSVIELIIQHEEHPHSESIAEETDRMRKGLDMALYISRLDTFTEDFYVQDVSLYEVANQVIQDNKRYFIRNYVYPEIQIPPRQSIKTDAKWLRFIIDQIVTNSIKYASGSRTKITLSTFQENHKIILEITDHGVGIPQADLPRVFQPFFTGENGRLFKESTGMGLHLVKTVLEKLNHEIEIESEVTQGTTVRIIF